MSDKEQAWLDEYLRCFDATAAARKVGYKWPGRQGYQKKQKYAAEIQKHLEEKAMGRDEALARLADIARGTAEDFLEIDENISLIDLKKMKRAGKLHLIKKYQANKRGISIELYDAQSAITTILKEFQPDGSQERPIHTVIKVTLTDD